MILSGEEPELQEGSDIPYHCEICKQNTEQSSIGKGQGRGKGRGKGKGKSKLSTSLAATAGATATASHSDVVHTECTQNVTQASVSSRG